MQSRGAKWTNFKSHAAVVRSISIVAVDKYFNDNKKIIPTAFWIIFCFYDFYSIIEFGKNYSIFKKAEKTLITTERMKIYPISIDEMKEIVKTEKNKILKTAYAEMLEGCLKYSENYIWYTLWFMELKNSSNVS